MRVILTQQEERKVMKEEGKVKKHFRKNKKFYIGTGVGVIIGAIGATVFVCKKYGMTEDEMQNHVMSQLVLNIKGRYNNPHITQQTISIYGNKIGHPGNRVIDLDTMKEYKSQHLAAINAEVSDHAMWKHLNGDYPDLNGRRFARILEGE